jgi:hypothetical protein
MPKSVFGLTVGMPKSAFRWIDFLADYLGRWVNFGVRQL